MPIFALILIILFSTAVGRALILLLPHPPTKPADPLEITFASLGLGTLINGWLALTLAELALFSVSLIALFDGLIITIALWQHGRQFWPHTLSPFPKNEQLMLTVWLIAAALFFFRPHQFILGGADAGVYVNLSSHIATTGQITIERPPLTLIDPDLYPAIFRWRGADAINPYIWFTGFTHTSPDTITPRFYHLAPVWQAAGFALAGLDGSLYITPLWGLLACLAFYMTVRRLWSWPWAAVSLWALTLTPFQLWFSRYHTTEPFTQYLFWLALWAFLCWSENDYVNKIWGLIAGLAFGSTFLARIDTFFLLPLPAVLLLWLWGQRQLKPHHLWFFAPLTLTITHSIFHGWFFARPYFTDIFSFIGRSIGRYPALTLLAIVIAILFLIAYLRWQNRLITLIGRYQTPLRITAVLVVISWAVYNWFIRPPQLDPETYTLYTGTLSRILRADNLPRLGWYLSPLTIWTAVLGTCLLLWRINRRTWGILLIPLIFTPLLVFDARANAIQIYVMRRYLPVVIPFLILATVAVWRTIAHLPIRWVRFAVVPLITLWLGLFAWHGRIFTTTVNFETLPTQIATLSAQLPEEAILIFNDPAPVGQADFLATPLIFLHHHHALKIYNNDLLDPAAFATTITNWQNSGYPVYWVDLPSGYPWPLPDTPLPDPLHAYTITYTALEERYDQPPSQTVQFELQGTIYPIPKITP